MFKTSVVTKHGKGSDKEILKDINYFIKIINILKTRYPEDYKNILKMASNSAQGIIKLIKKYAQNDICNGDRDRANKLIIKFRRLTSITKEHLKNKKHLDHEYEKKIRSWLELEIEPTNTSENIEKVNTLLGSILPNTDDQSLSTSSDELNFNNSKPLPEIPIHGSITSRDIKSIKISNSETDIFTSNESSQQENTGQLSELSEDKSEEELSLVTTEDAEIKSSTTQIQHTNNLKPDEYKSLGIFSTRPPQNKKNEEVEEIENSSEFSEDENAEDNKISKGLTPTILNQNRRLFSTQLTKSKKNNEEEITCFLRKLFRLLQQYIFDAAKNKKFNVLNGTAIDIVSARGPYKKIKVNVPKNVNDQLEAIKNFYRILKEDRSLDHAIKTYTNVFINIPGEADQKFKSSKLKHIFRSDFTDNYYKSFNKNSDNFFKDSIFASIGLTKKDEPKIKEIMDFVNSHQNQPGTLSSIY